jgi:hypothetical protein
MLDTPVSRPNIVEDLRSYAELQRRMLKTIEYRLNGNSTDRHIGKRILMYLLILTLTQTQTITVWPRRL